MARVSVLSRQMSLDPTHARDGMKVLEKFCKRKYRLSTFANVQSEQVETSNTPEPFTPQPAPSVAPPSARRTVYGQFSFDRFSTNLSAVPTRETSASIFSRQTTVADMGPVDLSAPTLREEIKFDRKMETKASYILRLLKVLYCRLGIKHVLLLILLFAYALLGGLVFYYLEAPAETAFFENLKNQAERRHIDYTRQIIKIFSEQECLTAAARAHSATREEVKFHISCSRKIREVLEAYDQSSGADPKKANNWLWNDYWNAVFYCATIFTTIGYGNMYCRTREGRLATICYALFGVPYMLVVLNSLGKVIFVSVENTWEYVRSKIRKKTKRFHEKYFIARTPTVESVDEKELNSLVKDETERTSDEETSGDEDLFETFPLHLALGIIFFYIGICSFIFCLWEDWDYFTAFYFFFISLMTVGLGDEIPEHPHYACVFFVFFIIGLALVSMCVSIMQMRVENRYMAALQLIEEEHQVFQLNPMDPAEGIPLSLGDSHSPGAIRESKVVRTSSSGWPSPGAGATAVHGIKWRNRATPSQEELHSADQFNPHSIDSDSTERSPLPRMPSTPTISGPHTPSAPIPPPVLGVFMARSRSTMRRKRFSSKDDSLRSSYNDGDTNLPQMSPSQGNGHPGQSLVYSFDLPFTAPVAESRHLGNRETERVNGSVTQTENGSSMPSTPTPFGVTGFHSPGSHTSPTNRTSHVAPLSVITEAFDEDSLDIQRERSSRRRPPPLQAIRAIEEEDNVEQIRQEVPLRRSSDVADGPNSAEQLREQ